MIFCGATLTDSFPDVGMVMMFSSKNWTERSLKMSRILLECSTVAEIPSFFHPLAVLVIRFYRHFPSFLFVLNGSLSYGSMAEEYIVVLGVAATGTVELAMAVIINMVTAVTNFLRTSESVSGAAVYLLLSFLCLRILIAIDCLR